MKRTYAMARLLEHGPLTLGEACAITCWPYRATQVALRDLVTAGTVQALRVDARRRRTKLYLLTEHTAHLPQSAFARKREYARANDFRELRGAEAQP